jgi:DNA-binding response OmpR family regulator
MNADLREFAGPHPCLIVAHPDATYSALVSRSFRRQGWDVYAARSGPEARRLACMMQADLMVMATDLELESGWLTCEKVTRDVPHVKVVLVGDATERQNVELARFVGAVTLVDQRDSVQEIVEDVCGRPLPAAG